MKVIDLLNKIANGEEVPNKFKFSHYTFEKQFDGSYKDEYGDYLFNSCYDDFSNINYEIEIIEKEQEEYQPIEKVEEIRELIEVSFSKLEEAQDKINR